MTVGLVGLVLLALLLEAGWVAMWPLSGALSHSALFNAAFLASHEPVAALFQATLVWARWLLPDLPATPLSEPLGEPVYLGPTVALAGVMLFLAVTYGVSLVLLNRGVAAQKHAFGIVMVAAATFQATLLFLPGLFSQDVFSYIAYGRLASTYDLNPYVWPPSAIAKDVVVPWVADVWRTYASPYGPVWVDVQSLMARLGSGLSIADQAMAYRLLANVLLLVNLGLAWWLLGRLTPLPAPQRTTALAALAWNPLVLFEVGGNAHNDVLMITFSLLALVLLVRSHSSALAGAIFALGALVKYLSGVGLVWIAVAAMAGGGTWKARGVRVAVLACVVAAMSLALAWPWLELPDSVEPLLTETAGVGYVNSLPDSLTVAVAGLVAPAGSTSTLDAPRSLERLLVLTLFGLYLVWEARRLWSEPGVSDIARACVRACLMYVLVVSTSVQPWYFCLPVALATLLGWRSALTRVTIGYSALALPALYLHYYLREATPGWVDGVYGLAPLLPLASAWVARLRRWTGTWPHGPTTEAVGDHEQRAGWHRVAGAVVEEAHR